MCGFFFQVQYVLVTYTYALQVVPVPRQALAAASLAIGPEQDAEDEGGEGGENDNEAPAKLCEKMVRRVFRASCFACLLVLIALRLLGVGVSREISMQSRRHAQSTLIWFAYFLPQLGPRGVGSAFHVGQALLDRRPYEYKYN